MKTEALISRLSLDLRPVRRLRPPLVRLLIWLAMSLLYVGCGIWFFGLRPDIRSILSNGHFLLNTFAILAVSIASAWTAFLLSVPGRREGIWTARAAKIVTAAWAVYYLLTWVIQSLQARAPSFEAGPGLLCAESVFELGLFPAIGIFWMVRKAAPLSLGKAGAFSMLAAAALAGFATQWICPYDFPLHFILWHVAPVVLIMGLGAILGRRFFCKRGSAAQGEA